MNAEEKIREVSIHTLSWFVGDWINKKKCEKCKLLAFDTTLKNGVHWIIVRMIA